jgi:hypothetical protein
LSTRVSLRLCGRNVEHRIPGRSSTHKIAALLFRYWMLIGPKWCPARYVNH